MWNPGACAYIKLTNIQLTDFNFGETLTQGGQQFEQPSPRIKRATVNAGLDPGHPMQS